MTSAPREAGHPSDEQMIAQFNRRADWQAEVWGTKPVYFDALSDDNKRYHLSMMRVDWSIVTGVPHDLGTICWCGFFHAAVGAQSSVVAQENMSK